MKVYKYIIILQLLLLYSCGGKHQQFIIEGSIDRSYNGQVAELRLLHPDTFEVLGSDTIHKGRFQLRGVANPDSIVYLLVHDADNPEYTLIYLNPILEEGTIQVEINDSIHPYSAIRGTPLNDAISDYYDSLSLLLNQLENETFDSRQKASEDLLKSFFLKHGGNAAGVKLFNDLSINEENLMEYYNLLSDLNKKHPGVEQTVRIHKRDLKSLELIGAIMPQHFFITQSGEEKSVSDYFGKSEYLYVGFWASWCGPCKSEIAELKKIYKSLQQNDVAVLSISIDSSKEEWKRALTQESMPWPQLVVKDVADIELVKDKYGIPAIPFTLLLDKTGKVLQPNIHSNYLLGWLEKQVKEK